MLRFSRHQPCVIAGTGAALPDATYSNREVLALYSRVGRRGDRTEQELDEMATLMGEQLGVEHRAWTHVPGQPFTADEQGTVELQHQALARALEASNLSGRELGAVITATSTPNRATGANAPKVAERVGATGAAFDVRSGCSGGILALTQACVFAAQTGQPVAAVGGDVFSKLAPPGIALAALALGDGAGAVIVMPGNDDRGLCGAAFAADGSLGHLAGAPAPFPPTVEDLTAGRYFMSGNPPELARVSPSRYREAVAAALECANVSVDDVDVFVPHQTSRIGIESCAEAVGIPMDKVVVTVGEHANCGAASALIAFDAAARAGRLGGATVLVAALGGGLAWGGLVLRC